MQLPAQTDSESVAGGDLSARPFGEALQATYELLERAERDLSRRTEAVVQQAERRAQEIVERAERQAQARAEGRWVGVGLASYVLLGGLGPFESAEVRVDPSGELVVVTGCSPHGQGTATALAQIVGDELGIPASDVKVVPQDLDRFGEGHGFATSPSQGTANAVRDVCGKIRQKAQILAGGMLGTSPQSLTWTGDRFAPGRDPSQGKRIEEIALYAHAGAIELPAGLEGSLDAQTTYRD